MFRRYLLGCVEEADIVFFEGYVSGFSCYLRCNSKVDGRLVVLQYYCWMALREPYVCSKLAEVSCCAHLPKARYSASQALRATEVVSAEEWTTNGAEMVPILMRWAEWL